MLEAQLQDGAGQPLGQVEEVILLPESGRLQFVAIRLDESLQNGGSLALVPLRALNVIHPGEDRSGGGAASEFALVLLVEQAILENAPSLDTLPNTAEEGWNGESFQYWQEYVVLEG